MTLSRDDVNRKTDWQDRLTVISTQDTLANLSTIVLIIRELQQKNDQQMAAQFHMLTGMDLWINSGCEHNKCLAEVLFKAKNKIDATLATFIEAGGPISTDTVDGLFAEMIESVSALLKTDMKKNEHVATGIFLLMAELVCVDYNERQQIGLMTRLVHSLTKADPSELVKLHSTLVYAAKHISLTPETYALWDELNLWLQGEYMSRQTRLLSSATMSADERDRYPADVNDKVDCQLKSTYGVSRFDISLYYFKISQLLQKQVDEYTEPKALQLSISRAGQLEDLRARANESLREYISNTGMIAGFFKRRTHADLAEAFLKNVLPKINSIVALCDGLTILRDELADKDSRELLRRVNVLLDEIKPSPAPAEMKATSSLSLT